LSDSTKLKADKIIVQLREIKLKKIMKLQTETADDTLTYHAVPNKHWRRARSNNPHERIVREIRRRTTIVGAFPGGQSALNLAAARLH